MSTLSNTERLMYTSCISAFLISYLAISVLPVPRLPKTAMLPPILIEAPTCSDKSLVLSFSRLKSEVVIVAGCVGIKNPSFDQRMPLQYTHATFTVNEAQRKRISGFQM